MVKRHHVSICVHISRSRSSKVIDFGTKQKHVCDFLLVCHSNLGSISPCFRDIAGFLLRNWRHPYPTPILGVFPLDHIADVGVNPSTYLNQFTREIIFEVIQPMWSQYLNVTDRETDREVSVAKSVNTGHFPYSSYYVHILYIIFSLICSFVFYVV